MCYFPFHIWDVIPTPLTKSIIFQDREIAPPSSWTFPILEEDGDLDSSPVDEARHTWPHELSIFTNGLAPQEDWAPRRHGSSYGKRM